MYFQKSTFQLNDPYILSVGIFLNKVLGDGVISDEIQVSENEEKENEDEDKDKDEDEEDLIIKEINNDINAANSDTEEDDEDFEEEDIEL